MSLLNEQNARIRALEVKAMGLLQVAAIITAIWAASLIADPWAPVYLLPGLAYVLLGIWSVMDVIHPRPRRVLSVPTQLTTGAPAAEAATAYEANVPVEIRHANLVTAALFDMLRGAAVILVVGMLVLGARLGPDTDDPQPTSHRDNGWTTPHTRDYSPAGRSWEVRVEHGDPVRLTTCPVTSECCLLC